MRLFFWMLTTAFLAGLFFADNTAKAVETALTADEAASHQASAAARDVLLAQRGKKKKRGRGHGKRSSGGKRFPPYKPSPAPERVTSGLYFIDAHSQMDENVNEERVISLMDHGGVRRTILSTHMQRDWSDIPDFAEAYPGRIIPSVRIKGRGYHRGSADAFYDRVGGQVTDGRFGSMSEVHFWHDSDGGKYQEIIIGFKDTLAMYAFAKAKKRGWPFIIHVEANAIPDERREPFLAEMSAFIAKNPDHPFLLIHMAQLEAPAARELLVRHPNLNFDTSHSSTFYQGGGKPFINLFDDTGKHLKAEWKALMTEYPDRFVFALDNVFSFFWTPERYLAKMDLWWRAVAELPDEVAHAFAHGNAARLWKLKPADGGGMEPPWVTQRTMGPVRGEADKHRGGL